MAYLPCILYYGFFVLTFFAGIQTKSLYLVCPPEIDCLKVNNNNQILLYKDHSNCSNYITCINGFKEYRPCPAGTHFNSVLNICDWPNIANCVECKNLTYEKSDVTSDESSSFITTDSNIITIDDQSNLTTNTFGPSCHSTLLPDLIRCDEIKELRCPQISDGETEWETTLLPVKWDCTQYIMCQRGVMHYRPCPDALHFNRKLKVCDFPRNAGCVECIQTSTTKITEGTKGTITQTVITETTISGGDGEENSILTTESTENTEVSENLDSISTSTDIIEISTNNFINTTVSDTSTFQVSDITVDLPSETTRDDSEIKELTKTTSETPGTSTVPLTFSVETDSTSTEEIVVTSSEPFLCETTIIPEPCDDSEELRCPQISHSETEWETTLLPVKWDCTQYIMCQRGVMHYRSCPDTLHFNRKLMVCDYPARAGCKSCLTTKTILSSLENSTNSSNSSITGSITVSTSTKQNPAKSSAESSTSFIINQYDSTSIINKCEEPSCPKNGMKLILLPVPWDCNQYIMCNLGLPLYRPCPAGTHFNQNLNVCDWPNNSQCIECNRT